MFVRKSTHDRVVEERDWEHRERLSAQRAANNLRLEVEQLREELAKHPQRGAGGKFAKRNAG